MNRLLMKPLFYFYNWRNAPMGNANVLRERGGIPEEPVVRQTSCLSAFQELQQIWNIVGESEEDQENMINDLEKECSDKCLNVYVKKVDEQRAYMKHMQKILEEAKTELKEIGVEEHIFGAIKDQLEAIFIILNKHRKSKEKEIQKSSASKGKLKVKVSEMCDLNNGKYDKKKYTPPLGCDEEGEGSSDRRSSRSSNGRPKECYFCLSSPNAESHLVTSKGGRCYCAPAKGPLVEDHALILPVDHITSTLSLPSECHNDLANLQNELKAYFKHQEKEVVFFEWVSKGVSHANLQAVPIPSAKSSILEPIFYVAAKTLGFQFSKVKMGRRLKGRKSLAMHLDENRSLFYVELPGGTILSHAVEENEKFPVHFGREVLAELLNMADRADWEDCLTKEEETKIAKNFKSRFQEYNPISIGDDNPWHFLADMFYFGRRLPNSMIHVAWVCGILAFAVAYFYIGKSHK